MHRYCCTCRWWGPAGEAPWEYYKGKRLCHAGAPSFGTSWNDWCAQHRHLPPSDEQFDASLSDLGLDRYVALGLRSQGIGTLGGLLTVGRQAYSVLLPSGKAAYRPDVISAVDAFLENLHVDWEDHPCW